VDIRLDDPRLPIAEGRARVVIDPYTGHVQGVEDPRLARGATRLLDTWLLPLHVGSFGGAAMRVAYLLFGLAPLILAATGLYWWWSRRRRPVPRA
jgi:uncharacterized iron-regulated membrane protein